MNEKARYPGTLPAESPFVTIQVCCYNESKVIGKTIDAACSLKYPKDRFEVHILDDSTDESKEIIDESAAQWRSQGISCSVLRRGDRSEYKAGNLSYGLKYAKGEFIAIFDADHRPHPLFLEKCMPFFFNEDAEPETELGLVQCPWSFFNGTENFLTKAQSLSLDAHFTVAQTARATFDGVFGFDGSGGVWRRKAIENCGGWMGDTVSESLDLSCRCIMQKEFVFHYYDGIANSLELPSNFPAFKNERSRWCRGHSQVLGKYFMDVFWMDISHPVKFQILFHLLENIIYPIVLWIMIISPIAAWCNALHEAFIYVFAACTGLEAFRYFVTIMFSVSCRKDYRGSRFMDRFYEIGLLFFIYAGSCLFLTSAFIEGLISSDNTFVRTPKYGDSRPNGLEELDDALTDKRRRRTHVKTASLASWVFTWDSFMVVYYIVFGCWVVENIHHESLPFALIAFGISVGLASSFSLYMMDEFREIMFRMYVGVRFLFCGSKETDLYEEEEEEHLLSV